ncbi:hypothetical protein PanWU01x14_224140 [Parasponia andersonii]|uniref:Uncharacterized protein n=1 Tax=Parasponia andersonii TaxID=3476 RepID=A0A2P5BNF1_PARAD|nr:hypothetical protein PanWU01x14_224140 [Parasponia andersonii]
MCQTQFREALFHDLEKPIGFAEEQSLVDGGNGSLGRVFTGCNRLDYDSDEEVFVEFVSNLLPLVENFSCSVFQCYRNRKDRHGFGDRNEFNLPPKNDSKASSSAPSYGPEKVFSHGRSVKNFPVNIDDFSIEDVVDA